MQEIHRISSYLSAGIQIAYFLLAWSKFAESRIYSLNITSVMLHHQLSWEDPEFINVSSEHLKYTVWFKLGEEDDWSSVFGCVNIVVNHCDLAKSTTEIFADMEYWFKVNAKISGSSKVVYNTSEIRFNPKHDTILVAPNITLTNVDNVIFIQPNIHKLANGERIDEHIKQLTHQIKYWPASNNTEVLHKSVKELHNAIPIQVAKKEIYCVSIRLFAKDVGSLGPTKTIFSPWLNPPSCIKLQNSTAASDITPAEVITEKMNEIVKFVCIGIACMIFLMLSTYGVFQTKRKWKYIFEKGPLPEVTLRVFRDSQIDPPTDNNKGLGNNYLTQESIDPLPPVGSELSSWRRISPVFIRKNEVFDFCSNNGGDTLQFESDTDYLREVSCSYPRHSEDETTSRINITYGLGTYILESEADNILDDGHSLMSPTIRSQMADTDFLMTQPTQLTSTVTPFLFNKDFLDLTQFRRNNRLLSQNSTSTTTTVFTETDLLFDIQRITYNPSPIRNIYLRENPTATTFGNRDFETYNVAYSCNPDREVPDLLSNDYVNF